MSSNEGESEFEDFEMACQEARSTLNQQIEKIHREDQKAIKMFRVNLLFVAVLASGLSIVVNQDGLTIDAFRTPHLLLGLTAIGFSTVLAAMSYTSSKFAMGFNADFLRDVRNPNKPDSMDDLISDYSTWIRKNQRVHRQNTAAINWIIILAISGALFFTGCFGVGLVGARGTMASEILLVFEIFASLLMGFFVYRSHSVFDFFTSPPDAP